MNIQIVEKLIKKSIKTRSFLGGFYNKYSINRYFSNSKSKISDIEQLILNDNLKNSNNNKILYSIESIIEKFPNKNDFQNYLNQTKPIGKQLYDFMILSRYSNDNDVNNSNYHNTFNKYLEEEILEKKYLIKSDDYEVSFDFILEFNSKSYRKFDNLFSILFNNNNSNNNNNINNNSYNNNNNNIEITSNQYSLFFDSIIKVQNKIQNDNTIRMSKEQEKTIDNLIIEIVDLYLNILKFDQIQLNINHYNKILEIYYNCSGNNINKSQLFKDTLDSIYLSFIKPDMETYMIAFPFISDTDSKLLLSKIKGDSTFKSGPNTYQLLSSQFDQLINKS
ncbi:hypothetical protein RB653_007837 [Dictyostelium firmibasis]|uniref:Uncharacterized protein n=1 Tax=Dictyostelium firmibasis TaxID=79012 RepID=A0AAN7U580_9MYCE